MKYPKVPHLTLEHEEMKPEDIIVIQEKVDGSQFRVWFEEDGIHFGSKVVNDTDDKMFHIAIESAKKIFEGKEEEFKWHTFFFEYVKKPKHNTLVYDSVPKNNLVLWDVHNGKEFLSLAGFKELECDLIPQLAVMNWKDLDMEKINSLLKSVSYLGGHVIEGIVVKRHFPMVLNKFSNCYEPIVMKYVREDFKEKNKLEWKDKKKGPVAELVETYRNVNRFKKAIQHLDERGELTNSVKDIGNIMKEVANDIEAEEKEEIKEVLYKTYRKDILKGIVRPIPSWYKELLTKGETDET